MTAEQVLVLQGAGPDAHDAWDARLVADLARRAGPGVEVRYPRLPGEVDPDREAWTTTIRAELAACADGVAVVAHSVGGTVLMSALSTPLDRRVGVVVLVAPPFLGEGGWPDVSGALPADLAARLPTGTSFHLVQGLADDVVPPSHADAWARLLPDLDVHRLAGRDHQLGDDLSEVAALLG